MCEYGQNRVTVCDVSLINLQTTDRQSRVHLSACEYAKFQVQNVKSWDLWRRRRDSNPRDGFPPTPLAGERLRPLGHISKSVSKRLKDC